MSIRQAQQIDPSSLSYRNPRQPIFPSSPTHAASSAMPKERSLTVVLGPLDTSYALVIPTPCESFFSKMLGRTLTGKSTCSSTCSLIRHSTSVCPLDTQGSFPYPQPRRTFRYPTSKLSFTTLFTMYSFTFPISERPHLLITPRKMTHSRSEAVVVEGSDSYR